MGYSTQSIPFFTDDIAIRPHTASSADHIGRKVSIRQFANGAPCRLEQRDDNGEYIVSVGTPGTASFRFMEGPET